jgi:hypothetical protein
MAMKVPEPPATFIPAAPGYYPLNTGPAERVPRPRHCLESRWRGADASRAVWWRWPGQLPRAVL